MFKRLLLITLMAIIAMGIGAQQVAADSSWNAEYWDNKDLSGSPVVGWKEDAIDHDWGGGTPHSSITGQFSARWTRRAYFAPGTYRFNITTDDGMRVWVDGNKIIDSWYDSQVHSLSADIYLDGGDHDLKVEYYEAGGQAVAKMNWFLVSGGGGTWRAEYFNNTSLSGTPAVTRQEDRINYEWGGSPVNGINADQFSVRWSGSIPVDSGVYRFTATADDGVRVWIQGMLAIDAWREQKATSYSVDVSVTGGTLPVLMEYYEAGGTGAASLSWTKISGTSLPAPAPTFSEWRGEYFNNIDLNGNPVLLRNDPAINFSWGSSTPAPNVVNPDQFSARWTRTVNLNRGTYTFTATPDDGMRVWVNNQLIIDQWKVQSGIRYSTSVFIPGGATTLRVEYFEYSGLAEARLTWSAGGSTTTSPPASSGDVPQTAVMRGAAVLNVRSGPGMNFNPFTHLRNGDTVTLIGRDANNYWIKVRLSNGQVGWASSRYLRASAPFVNLPVTN
ncbi:MAG: PA14 domain-containing protein [Ardenticatenaceae bacterium]|nr:PA14 domain-containing protein [Ardenticatenaceae bacterium]